MKLLVNGEIQSATAKLPYSLSLLRGDGLFETILTVDEKVIAWQRHYDRLSKSAERLLIAMPAKIDIELGITKILQGCLGHSRMRLSVLSDGQWLITVEPEITSDKPITLMKATGVKSSNGSLSGVKSISYGESLLVVRKAQQLGFDDGILLNENNHVVETAFSNLLILTSDGWLTPDLKTGCLPGITRELLIKWFEVKEGSFTFEQLLEAKAVYVTSSIRLIQPVSKVGDQLFDESLIGIQLITQFSQRLFSNINP